MRFVRRTGFLALLALPLAVAFAAPAQAAAADPQPPTADIAAGAYHTCAILDNGDVSCWGFGGSGRLGYGNNDNIGDNETPGSAGAVDLGAGRTATSITAGFEHTCAILDNGDVSCWGIGLNGKLGYGNTNSIGDDETPGSAGAVNLGAGRTATSITAGSYHTCAILDNGEVRCWGLGSSGRLGYGNTDSIGDDETPASAGAVNLGAGRTATSITAGSTHTCAVLDNGEVSCWGSGGFGRLGYGNTNTIGDDETPASAGAVNLGAGRTASSITAGNNHTCAILDNGEVSCWGSGTFGQPGYGNTDTIGDNETPGSAGAVNLGAGRTATSITAGSYHTCAILDNSELSCWGWGGNGRLGYGNTDNIGDDETPASAGAVNLGAGRTATSIAAGFEHTCAILDSGEVNCWGSGTYGQPGYGNTNTIGDDETPGSAGAVNLGAGPAATSITAGSQHTCAILDNGEVSCWGDGTYGQLGYGNTNSIGDDETPGSAGAVNLGAGRTATSITAGGYHTCAILDNGEVRCWGYGFRGRLGYGNSDTIGDDETPASAGAVNLGAGRTATSIAAGFEHTCAILDNGEVICWGSGASGRLGYGNTDTIGDNETPDSAGVVDLGAGRTATSITAGYDHTCAILDNAEVSCWGLGSSGTLGYGNTNSIGDDETPGSAGAVNLGAGRTATSITAGRYHTCAILDNGELSCWGLSRDGRLGYGNTDDIGDDETPASAGAVNLGAGRTATSITAGGAHTCAILDNGEVICWGSGAFGQPGYGNTDTIGDNETPDSAGAVNLGAGRTATSITAGYAHTCAILDNGELSCWGFGSTGQLGYGNTDDIGDDETPDTAGAVNLGAGRTATLSNTIIYTGPSASTNEPTPTFSFASNKTGATFECRVDSEAFASCSSPETVAALGDGSHTFEVKGTDGASNTDPSPATRTFTVDTTPPDTTIDTGPSGTISNPTPSFEFSSEPGATFECRVDSEAFASCSSPETVPALGDGSHTFEVKGTDGASNTDPSPATRTFTVDTTPPDTTIDTGPSGTISNPTPSFEFSSEPGATFECRVDSEAFASCSSPETLAALSDGPHAFEARATDAVGNTDLSAATRFFIIDTTPPDTTIDTRPSGTITTNEATFTFAGDPAGDTAKVQCRIDSEPFADCLSPTVFTGLSEGPHTAIFRAEDALGNQDQSPSTSTFTVDTTIYKATIGKVSVKGPAKPKKGKKATYKVKVTNSGNIDATGVKLKVKGKGVKAKKTVGSIPAGNSKTVKVKLKFKKPGKVKLTFKVTSSNAGGKSAKKKVTVKK